MAYDEDLAERVRALTSSEPELTEKKMFGGLAFLINGNIAVAASGQGGLMVRVDPSESESLLRTTTARLVEMRGRQMPGWMRVDNAEVRSEQQLTEWVSRGVAQARALPPKP
jgi:TfoX/Sxy family transcriptional regulator of competence genes